jgi:glycerol-3-phosphate O-acyltransferase
MDRPPPTPQDQTASRGIGRLFEPVRVPREAPAELAGLAARGSLVFVMRRSGLLNFLYLRWLLRRHGLPPLQAAQGYTGLAGALSRIRRSRRALEEGVGAGRSTVLFLGDRATEAGPLEHLVRMQRSLARPVFLVPIVLLWSRRAQRLQRSLGDVLFGTPDSPNAISNAVAFFRNFRHCFLSVGRAVDLQARVAARPDASNLSVARSARGEVLQHLSRELRAAVGPPLKDSSRVKAKVLRDRSLRTRLEDLAAETGRPLAGLRAEAARCLDEIASNYDPKVVALARPFLKGLFSRLYESLEIDEDGLGRVKRAAATAPVIICPSHKSYVDFLVISWLLYEHGMMAPHIAAGINLSFWPAGPFFRRGGAFFIRRHVKGDRVYAAVLRSFVKQLLRDKFPQEFYIEGGRSRTGKLLFPKMGLVSMEVDAWLDGAAEDVLFVPVSIDYEQLIEASAYLRELSGGEKPKENLRGLLSAFTVLFRSYERLYVQFEAPVSLRAVAQARLGARVAGLATDAEARRLLVQAVATRVAFGIGRAVTITPVGLVCAALLSHVRRGLPAAELTRRVELLRFIAAEGAARFGRGLAGASSDPLQPGPVQDAVRRLVGSGQVTTASAAGETIYRVVEEKRPVLDYHRNAVIHRYVAPAIAASALLAAGEAPLAEVRERAAWLSRLFKLEFMYEPGAELTEVFGQNIAFLQRLGAVELEGERIRPGAAREPIEFLAEFLRPYLEAYRLAAETALLLLDDASRQSTDRKSLLKLCLERGRADVLTGRMLAREALSKATLENSIDWLVSTGRLVDSDGRLDRTADPDALREIIDGITRHLSP